MLKWIKESDYFRCAWMTLIGSSVFGIVLVGGLQAVAATSSEVSPQLMDKYITLGSIPWFVFWYLFCKFGHNIKITVATSEAEEKKEDSKE